MAFTPFLIPSTLLLFLSLLVIASASDYGYAPKPDYGKPKTEGNDKPFPSKPEYHEKPELIVGIEGVVLCKSGSKYVPIQGNLYIQLFFVTFSDIIASSN